MSWRAVVVAALLAATPLGVAQAQQSAPTADNLRAKSLFRAGASAYKVGNFSAAVQAFDQAHAIDPKPAIRFSAAQALRRWYAVSEDPGHLVKALHYYREYLGAVKTGGRVLDASRAKNEIEILLAQLGVAPDGTATNGEDGPSVVAPRRVPASRGTLMIDGPELPGAVTSIDGKVIGGWPVFAELTPGRYKVRVEAPGYEPFERPANTVAGQLTPVEASLTPLPGRIAIASDDGAEIIVDGRPMGRLPLPSPLALPSGTHRVVLGRSGYQVFAKDVALERGQEVAVDAPLSMTAQRVTSWVFFGGAGAGAAAGITLAVFAVRARGEARDIRDAADDQGRALEVAEARDYNAALQRRDDFTQAAGATLVLGAASAGVGLLLYLLDDPDLYAASASETLGFAPAPRDLDDRARGGVLTFGGHF
jgi:tetratricopeptide (TPR) repeat protein